MRIGFSKSTTLEPCKTKMPLKSDFVGYGSILKF
nr:MAG TPA: hypothetical protein [Caudoviricetes sp.]DAY30627.1 MAG TPA: hypothetical protein [Bacteriophage sp.]